MSGENLPFGEGIWEVWGVVATEREDNSGLRSTMQRVGSSREQPVYRTDDEQEARQLVQEGGFNRNGQFYATTRIVNTAASNQKTTVGELTGVHQRQKKGELPIQETGSQKPLSKTDPRLG